MKRRNDYFAAGVLVLGTVLALPFRIAGTVPDGRGENLTTVSATGKPDSMLPAFDPLGRDLSGSEHFQSDYRFGTSDHLSAGHFEIASRAKSVDSE